MQAILSDISHSSTDAGCRINPTMEQSELVDRIKRRLRHIGRSPIKAAQLGGLERNYLRDLIEGKKGSVREANLSKIAKGLDWSKEELLGQDDVNSVSHTVPSDVLQSIEVPEIEVRAGAAYAGGFSQEENVDGGGSTSISSDVVRARWGIPPPFLRDELHLQPGRVHILAVKGDSMVDTLYDGDRAIIALDDTDVSQGGVFAILDDNGSVIIKQVELVRGGKGRKRIVCKSRNPLYQPFELALEDPVKILGRVACKITRI